ncbi:MAG: hypothetical protein UV58_C0001G0031 [Candidatus Wolfebacteria bacterium GW2011_GWC1_43_10]|uniref:Transcriptional repressor PaaX-like central Cas2-like domain-containing protein n=2 Tax=Candidatus Wolfeibacteriota TaxID=1752735 RepID=A0A0G1CCJ5_9BACT|nr:MAG: hypothetical protein UV58_C0001G0031 [Candidatus Wolfebacteria bacterium GW2011_GWC1_43_10]KKT22730.1 MAG: hypothetical protein UW08_C0004G0026 [Parcubacteria group bacterium GW2011_GWB1_43_8b]
MPRHKYTSSLALLSVLSDSLDKWMGLDDLSLNNQISKNRNRYYQIIRRLSEDNLIEKSKKGRSLFISITQKGRNFLRRIISSKHKSLDPYIYKDNLSKSDSVIIVAFDIPEKLRFRRKQIREVLKSLDFKMVQKSVWVGKNKIPDDFIKDLRDLKLLVYIDIFSINKSGSLKNIL